MRYDKAEEGEREGGNVRKGRRGWEGAGTFTENKIEERGERKFVSEKRKEHRLGMKVGCMERNGSGEENRCERERERKKGE